MLTDFRRANRRLPIVVGVVAALLMLIAIGQFFVAAGATDLESSHDRLSAQDIASLGDVILGEPPTRGMERNAAMSAANALYDAKALGASGVDAFLETVTVEGTLATDEPISKRAAWVIRLTGMAIDAGGPPTDKGKPAASHVLTTAFIFLDAETGEFLMTVWTE